MKKLDSLKLNSEKVLTDSEMKNLKGGFDCGSGLTYYTGSCTNGAGFSICASGWSDANSQASGFCSSYGSGY